jgi:AcrR family transcriptional regulator
MVAARKSIDPRKQPVQKRGQDKVDSILKATLQLLRRNHPNSITASLIAAKAGINIASLYQFFPNKEAIFHTLYQNWLEQITEGYDLIEAEYLGKTNWRDFFTRLRDIVPEVGYDSRVEASLDYVMAGSKELSEIDEFHAASLAQRMTGYLRAYGSTWTDEKLTRLSRLLYEFGWAATYRTVGESTDCVEQIHDWTRQAHLSLIESCLEGTEAACEKRAVV